MFLLHASSTLALQVSGFRKTLWGEHLGHYDPKFDTPDTLECMREVNRQAEANWAAFVSETFQDMPYGHLLKYPYFVDQEGDLQPTLESFPDLDASIMGNRYSLAILQYHGHASLREGVLVCVMCVCVCVCVMCAHGCVLPIRFNDRSGSGSLHSHVGCHVRPAAVLATAYGAHGSCVDSKAPHTMLRGSQRSLCCSNIVIAMPHLQLCICFLRRARCCAIKGE